MRNCAPGNGTSFGWFYLIAGSEGRALGGGIGAGLGLIAGGIVGKLRS